MPAARTRLNLAFKGSRDYLTGADILMELLPLIDPAHNISLRFHRLTAVAIDLVALQPNADPSLYDGVILYDDTADRPHRAALEAISAQSVTERVPYPEDLAVADAEISDQSIVSHKAEGFSFIERAIALNKVLLTKLCGTDAATKWIFTRIDMPERPHMPMPRVKLTALSTSNPRLIKSALYLNETPFGHIWFAGVKQHNG